MTVLVIHKDRRSTLDRSSDCHAGLFDCLELGRNDTLIRSLSNYPIATSGRPLHEHNDQAPIQKSGFRTSDPPRIPTLSEMIRDGQQSAAKIKRATKEALVEWFAQSERLNIARTHYLLRGGRFSDFARRIGIDRSSAYQLLKLSKHKAAILARCADEGRYYGWETCLTGSTQSRPFLASVTTWLAYRRVCYADRHIRAVWQGLQSRCLVPRLRPRCLVRSTRRSRMGCNCLGEAGYG